MKAMDVWELEADYVTVANILLSQQVYTDPIISWKHMKNVRANESGICQKNNLLPIADRAAI